MSSEWEKLYRKMEAIAIERGKQLTAAQAELETERRLSFRNQVAELERELAESQKMLSQVTAERDEGRKHIIFVRNRLTQLQLACPRHHYMYEHIVRLHDDVSHMLSEKKEAQK